MVEDSDADAELVVRSLTKGGVHAAIHRVETEPALVQALREMAPDIILSDFSLPQFDGLRALDVAVAHAPETPFIFVSGTIGEERAIDALRRGAIDYVLKTNLSRLPAAVERALRDVSLKAERARSEQQRRDQEIRLQRLTRTYRMLSMTSSAILRLRNRGELFNEVCRIAAQQGGYARVVISLIDPEARTARPRAWAGMDSPTLRAVDCIVLDSARDSPGMTEHAIRSGAPSVHNDLVREPQPPAQNEAFGVIALFSSLREVFDASELDVLLELTANLGFALQYLEKDEAVHFLSYFDSLTGLAKRPLFCRRLAQLMSVGATDGGTLTVVAFDVQKLGMINDSLGRYMGDRLLEKIAVRLKQAYADTESAGYFGGGTFALMLTDTGSAADTGRMLQNAAAKLFVKPFDIDGQELRPTIRSGVAFYPHDADTADALVQNAEAALKAAQEDNEKYMLYGLVTQRPTSRSLALEARLSGALERDEFRLHYQPKVNIGSGRIEGLEALLRWQDTEDGLVAPSIFVPLLERSGAIVDVGEWVLLQAIRDIIGWEAAGLAAVRVAVNVSPLQLRRRDFADRVLATIASTDERPCSVDIEITESMLMQDLELSIRKLAQLREAGIGIAIDDFGTGYSSLRLLAKLPVDTLKVDRSFIQSIADTPNVATLVSTIVSLARAFDMHTVAEGVETTEQLEILRAMKCEEAQGYLFGRPTPASEVAAAIARLSQAAST